MTGSRRGVRGYLSKDNYIIDIIIEGKEGNGENKHMKMFIQEKEEILVIMCWLV